MHKLPLLILTVGLLLVAGSAQADEIVTAVINNAAAGNGPIQSWSLDLTTGIATATGSFVPQGAVPGGVNGSSPNGRAIAVTNTQFYYTELSNLFGPTVNIETGLYNGGAGGPDNGHIVNPLPGTGVQNLHFGAGPGGGDLYAVAGYPSQGLSFMSSTLPPGQSFHLWLPWQRTQGRTGLPSCPMATIWLTKATAQSCTISTTQSRERGLGEPRSVPAVASERFRLASTPTEPTCSSIAPSRVSGSGRRP